MRARGSKRLPNYAIGIVLVLVLAAASWLAFTKQVPWGGGNEYQAVFNSAQNLRNDAPIRVAGVEVGKVTGVEAMSTEGEAPDGEAIEGPPTGALVTMEIDDGALPLKEDAQFKLRPRLFLEGNLFMDVEPGSPTSPTVDTGYVFPPQQTANSVQLDEVLTGAFQADARRNLQTFLDQFGEALIDEGGAKSLKVLNRASPDAFKFTSQVNQALLGERPHDLSNLIVNLDRVINGLNGNETALQGLVTNLRITTGSFAAQSGALRESIRELPRVLDAAEPAFVNLNQAFPPLRAFAREALPGVRTADETLVETTPLLRQLRGLSTKAELRGLVADLKPTVPKLAKLTKRTIPFLEQTRALSSCFNNVILPFANDRIDSTDPGYNADHGSKGTVFEETGYGLAGISGESRSGDANGQYIRVIGGGGTNTVQTTDEAGNMLAGLTPFPIIGAMPAIESSAKTPYRPDVPCETQDPPDLTAFGADDADLPTNMTATGTEPTEGKAAKIREDSDEALGLLSEAAQAAEDGDKKEAKEIGKEATEKLELFKERYGSE